MAVSTPATGQDWEQEELDPEFEVLLRKQEAVTEAEYLRLTDSTNWLVELVDNCIEVLPMPTKRHQAISKYLLLAFLALTQRINGDVLYAPLRLRIRPGNFREPDLLLVRSADDPRWGDKYVEGADLVVEVVSPDQPDRDYVAKRRDYAEAGVLEYWIVDPQLERITVLASSGASYREHGVFGRGDTASSALFPEFSVSVDAVLVA